MDPLAQRRAALLRTISNAQLQLDALEGVPTEDTYADGTIIRAAILNPGKRDPVTYVFLKVQTDDYDEKATGRRSMAHWYHTGFISHVHSTALGNKPYFRGWPDLQRWLSEPNRVVETWTILEPRCERDHPGPRVKRAYEDVCVAILEILRRIYSQHYGDDDVEHVRAINSIMHVSGVYE